MITSKFKVSGETKSLLSDSIDGDKLLERRRPTKSQMTPFLRNHSYPTRNKWEDMMAWDFFRTIKPTECLATSQTTSK